MFQGYTNYETWNVMMWIQNEHRLYEAALRFLVQEKKQPTKGLKDLYKRFIVQLGMESRKTPDGIKWMDDDLDYRELDEEMFDMMTSMTVDELRKFLDFGDGIGVVTEKDGERSYWFVPNLPDRDTFEYALKRYDAMTHIGEIDRYTIHVFAESVKGES